MGRAASAAAAVIGAAALCACASTPDRVSPRPTAAASSVGKVGRPYTVRGQTYTPRADPGYDETGLASWYGGAHQGKPTASGEPFDLNRLSAAHKTLPLPSWVLVENLDNGKRLKVRINDRGPFVAGRIIDLSQAAAEALGFKGAGVAKVRVRAVEGERIVAERRPEPREEPRDGGRWLVQAGAFAEAANAERAAERLRAVGRTDVRSAESGGRLLHRVTVGPWDGADAAEAARRRAAALGFADARVAPAS